MTPVLDIPVLQGRLVRLEALSSTHAPDLADAVEEDRSSFEYTWVPSRMDIEEYISASAQQAESGKLAPLAQVRLADNRAVGCTAYFDPRAWPGRPSEPCAVGIGWTWLAASAQGTGINIEAKRLLLRHAFEGWGGPGSTSRRMCGTTAPDGLSRGWGQRSRASAPVVAVTGPRRGGPSA